MIVFIEPTKPIDSVIEPNDYKSDGRFMAEVTHIDKIENKVYVRIHTPLYQIENETLLCKCNDTIIDVPAIDNFHHNDSIVPVSNRQHEENINENKRNIKLISKQLLYKVLQEFKDLM